MLIQNKSLALNDIVVVKFPGEEVIGRVVTHPGTAPGGETLRLAKPLRILLQMVQGQNGAPEARITFAPFMVGLDDDAEIEIDLPKLLVKPMKAGKEIGDAYRQQTSPLDLPPAPSLLRP